MGSTSSEINGGGYGKIGISDADGKYTYYDTLQEAIDDAVAGQTVQVLTSVTETAAIPIVLKDLVNINLNGNTFTIDNASATNFDGIKDNNLPVTCKITNGTIKRIGARTSDSLNYLLEILHVDSNIDATGTSFISETIAAYVAGKLNGGYYRGETVQYQQPTALDVSATGFATNIVAESFFAGNTSENYTVRNSGKLFGADISNIRGYALIGTGESSSINATSSNNILPCVRVYVGGRLSKATAVSHGTGSTIIVDGRILNSYAYSTGGYAIEVLNGHADNCTGISEATHAIRFSSGNSSGSILTGYSNGGAGIAATNGILINSNGKSSVGRGIETYFYTKVTNSTSISEITVASLGCGIWRNCSFISNWDNVGGHAYERSYTVETKFLGCTFTVKNAGAYCIGRNNGAVADVHYVNCIFLGANVPVNPTLTQAVTNTNDNQGNITL